MNGQADARMHILTLIDSGMTSRTIARLCGLHESQLSKFRRGQRSITADMLSRIMRVTPEDKHLPADAVDAADELMEEYAHFCGRLGWPDEQFIRVVVPRMGIGARRAAALIEDYHRERSPNGLAPDEVGVLVCAEGDGELDPRTSAIARRLAGRGLLTVTVWRGKTEKRFADLTEKGRRVLKEERSCQS